MSRTVLPICERSLARPSTLPLGVVLLGVGGIALVGAGALLAWQRGAMVSVGESVLAAIAWCI